MGVLCDISILKIEEKTLNMYIRKGGAPTLNYKMPKGVRGKMCMEGGGVKNFSCHPHVLFFFFFFFWNSPNLFLGKT